MLVLRGAAELAATDGSSREITAQRYLPARSRASVGISVDPARDWQQSTGDFFDQRSQMCGAKTARHARLERAPVARFTCLLTVSACMCRTQLFKSTTQSLTPPLA
jgi:hypothetical protein